MLVDVSLSLYPFIVCSRTAYLLLILCGVLCVDSVEIDGSFGESDAQKETGSKKRYEFFLGLV